MLCTRDRFGLSLMPCLAEPALNGGGGGGVIKSYIELYYILDEVATRDSQAINWDPTQEGP